MFRAVSIFVIFLSALNNYAQIENSSVNNNQSFNIKDHSNSSLTPPEIPGLCLWLSADNGVVLNGNYVSQWNDQSTNAFIAIQGTESSQPLFVNSNQSIFNKPAIKFDGIDDFLKITNNITIGTVFMVFNWDGPENTFPNYNGAFTSSVAPYDMIIADNASTNLRFYVFTEGNIFINGMVTNNFYPLQKFKIAAGKDPTPNAYSDLYIGNTEGVSYMSWNGKIAEIIAYDNALSTNDRIAVEQYLRLKYAPPVNLGPDIIRTYGICSDTLKAGNHFTNYIWNTGNTQPTQIVKSNGIYSVTVTDIFGFTSRDTVIVSKPTLNIKDTTICQFTSAVIDPHLYDEYYTYLWSTSETTPTITVSNEGLYWLEMSDTLSCVTRDSFYVTIDMYPSKASLGNDTTLCSGDSIGLVWGAPQTVSYLWNDNSTKPYLVIETPGTYHVTVTDNIGCVARDTIDVAIKGPLPDVAFTSDAVCFGGTTHFTDYTVVPPPYSIIGWQWDFGDFSTPSFERNPTHTYAAAGIYNVTLTATTNVGCSKSHTKAVYVYSIPVADLYPNNGCTNVPVEFHDNTQNQLGNINYWHWNFGDPGSGVNNESFLKDPVHTFATAGNYIVTLAVASEAGCRDTVIRTVIIRQSADVDFAFTDECDKDAVYFTDLTVTPPQNNILEWHWDFGDGYTSGIQNPSHLYETAGEYEVVLSVKTLNGCTVSITKNVLVNATPQPDFVLTDICAAVPYQFIDNSYVQNGSITEWEWQIIDLDTQYIKNPVFTFPTPGTYTVKLITTTQAGCKDSISRTVTVYKSPEADFSFSPKFGVAPLTINFINKSEGGISYHWNFGDGSGTSLLKNPSYTFTENGIYNISLHTYNENDCYDSIVKQLKIIPSSLDIAVKEVDAVVSNNYLKVSAELINLGTRTIEDLYLYIETSQGGSIRESWTGILETGDILSYEFTAEIPLNGQSIDYVCVRAANPDQPIDDNPANDEKCKALVEDFILLEPYPNPTGGILNIPFILPMADEISIVLYSANGSKIRELYNGEGTKGYNIKTFDFSKLAKGMYACQLRYRDKVKVVKFVKE